MTNLVQQVRGWLTAHHLAQLALLVQPLIVFRTAGEYFRLKWAASASLPARLDPLFVSLAALGVAAIVSLVLYFGRRERAVIVVTLIGIAALIVYKLIVMPSLG